MKLRKEVHRPCNCQEKIDEMIDQRARNAAPELWLGSIIECDCGKWWRLADGRHGIGWVESPPTSAELLDAVAPPVVASPGRTRL